ncbi:hypothetical protein GCM10010124_18080 [Pilimelia terevasa]|uniref:Lon N-terminal domain-containing protein n=1 Tax=Pilimelia terevasa TaxID=53372 RepID=A0A8J3BJN6_9ACTN|nr:LON peptidase substrate-binding domain-containing protein [Pilimelia terevasa]GGK25940.1 hypothetical protein GCM10010124_18080 [Pilimelia terevasa]
MSARLALLPLPTVLFPGLVLPLRVVEERYRALVRRLVALPARVPREFGVVAIHRGNALLDRPVDATGRAVTLHAVGCAAVVRTITAHADGRYDVVVVGRRRFEVEGLDTVAAPYLTAEVRWLPEPAGAGAAALVPQVCAALRRYLAALDGDTAATEQLPTDPRVVSYLVGAVASLSVDDRQLLLAAPDTAARLRTGQRLLSREAALLGRIRAVPQPLARWTTHPLPN